MKVRVKKDTCIGCGLCVSTSEEVFSFDTDGLAKADNSKINDENLEDVKIAIEGCPVGAIVEETE